MAKHHCNGCRFSSEEQVKKLISIQMDLRKREDWLLCDWQDLSDRATEAISCAAGSLRRKNYKLFCMYLLLYSDIWKYAHERLDQRDYEYFCCSQSLADATGIQ